MDSMNARAWAVTIAQIIGVGVAVLLIDNMWVILAVVVGILVWPRTPKEARTDHPTTTRDAKNVTAAQPSSSESSASNGSDGQNT